MFFNMAIPTEDRYTGDSSNSGQNHTANNNINIPQQVAIDVPDGPQMTTPSSSAIVAGTDSHGDTIYLGQVIHQDTLLRYKLPAFITPAKQEISVFHNGYRIHKEHFVYLEHSNDVHWIPHLVDDFKENAFKCGKMEISNGVFEDIFVGRVYLDGRFVPGRVSSDQKFLFLPGLHQETPIPGGFELLVRNHDFCSAKNLCQCCIF